MSTKDVAGIHDAKYNHLAKVTQWLANEGYIETQRGRAGGMKLALDPAKINIGTVTRKLEKKSALVECMQADGGSCKLSPACGLSFALNQAREAFFSVLDDYTLKDLIAAEPQMLNLLLALHDD